MIIGCRECQYGGVNRVKVSEERKNETRAGSEDEKKGKSERTICRDE
jgi:hypothetical protein